VYVVANGKNYQNSAPAAKGVRYKTVTTYLTGTSGTYDIVVTASNTGTVLATLPNQAFDSEKVYTMVIGQNSNVESAAILQLFNDSED
jgi:seryl-tRNA(Sec) selenium transferase